MPSPTGIQTKLSRRTLASGEMQGWSALLPRVTESCDVFWCVLACETTAVGIAREAKVVLNKTGRWCSVGHAMLHRANDAR